MSLVLLGCLDKAGLKAEQTGRLADAAQRRYQGWIAGMLQAGMNWLAVQSDLKFNPQAVLDGFSTMLVFAMPWNNATALGGQLESGAVAPIAAYAEGPDYHKMMRKKIRSAMEPVQKQLSGHEFRILIDANPLSERFFAALTGQGFIGRNGMFIIPGLGSRFFLATVLTSVPVEVLLALMPLVQRNTDSPSSVSCPDDCRKCLDACPTGALHLDFDGFPALDARRCLSYHSIESESGIPLEFRQAMGQRIFGCDSCVEACPFNPPQIRKQSVKLAKILRIRSHEDQCQQFAGTSVMRANWMQLLSSACVAAGNSGENSNVEQLREIAQLPVKMVAEQAQWALGQIEK